MKVAIAQLNQKVGDFKGNVERILEAANRSAATGCELLLTPELSLCGYFPHDLLLNEQFVESNQQALRDLMGALPPELAVLVGFVDRVPAPVPVEDGEIWWGHQPAIANGAALIRDGRVEGVYHKMVLPDYDVLDERRYFASGQELFSFQLDQMQVGVTIGEDVWGPSVARLVQAGAKVVVNLSASPYHVGKEEERFRHLSRIASHNQCWLFYANQVGGNDELIFDGQSMVFNGAGCMVMGAPGFKDAWGFVDTDTAVCRFADGDNGVLPAEAGGARVFDQPLLAPVVECDQDRCQVDYVCGGGGGHGQAERVYRALVLGLGDFVEKNNFRKVVLGLSGGVDAALVAALAAHALGGDQVLGVLMPSPYTSETSVSHALELAENLGVKTLTVPIGSVFKEFTDLLAPVFEGREADTTEENLQARARGMILMAISNKLGHMVLNTGNKSELSVGYCTLYGDMAGGLSVLADVPKTMVWEVCRFINAHKGREVIPAAIIDKAPSAELRPNQLDEDSLPPYHILDRILEGMVEHSFSVEHLVADGFDRELTERVFRMVNNSEYKRKQMAPGLRISPRAFGAGWRMPVAARKPV